jgi:transcription elongation factor Elf1
MEITRVKCTNCGLSIQPMDLDEYEAKLAQVVEQTGGYPSTGLQIDDEREDGTVGRAELAPMENPTEFKCPRCGKAYVVGQSADG